MGIHSDIMASPKIIFTVLTFAFSLHWASGSDSPNISNDQLSEKLQSLEVVILELAAGQEDLQTKVASLESNEKALATDVKNHQDATATEIHSLQDTARDNSKALELYHIGFSCHRDTRTEWGVGGVVTYTDCEINEFNIMSPSTGRATIPRDGEFFITFFADLVSDGGWAFCTLFKKSGTTLTELGLINNELLDETNEEITSTTSSMSVLAKLRQGDELYVELGTSGDSHLFSDTLRRVSFTAFLLKDI